jgi:DNA polymerase-3 subunit epsilon
MEAAAQAVHGLSVEKLAGAPTWPEIYPRLCEIVAGKTVVIYNDQFDIRLLWQTCEAWQLDETLLWDAEHTFAECAMLKYSAWVGEYNARRDRPGIYKWQKLPGGDHSAVGDCLATLEVIRQMAASLEFGEENEK